MEAQKPKVSKKQPQKQTPKQTQGDEDIQKQSEFWLSHTGFFDIAANLSDDRFKGKYYGKDCHPADFEQLIKRANLFGVKKFLFAAGFIEDAKESYHLSLKSEDFYATVGIHPCRALEPFKSLGAR